MTIHWPKKIIAVDDTQNSENLRELIEDIRWVNEPDRFAKEYLLDDDELEELKSALENLSPHVQKLAKDSPNIFKGRTWAVVVTDEADVERAKNELEEDGSAIAFIDFDYVDKANPSALEEIDALYERLDSKWRMAEADKVKGGCVFSSSFSPSVQNPARVLCPTTYAEPDDLEVEVGEARTSESYSLRKKEVNFAKAICDALETWVRLQKICPLDSIWHHTRQNKWFKKGGTSGVSRENMPHDPPSQDDYRHHKEAIEEVLGLDLPEIWWQNRQSVSYVHESLKHMCGWHYYGSGTEDGDRNLTVGSVYIIALLAKRDAGEKRDISDLLVDDEQRLAASDGKAAFLSTQDAETAKTTARALYYLLRIMFTEDPKHVTREDLSLAKICLFSPSQGKFSVALRDWKGEEVAEKLDEAGYPDVHNLDEEEWRDDFSLCLRKMWHCMNTSSEGFGCPGTVTLQKDELIIGSAQ